MFTVMKDMDNIRKVLTMVSTIEYYKDIAKQEALDGGDIKINYKEKYIYVKTSCGEQLYWQDSDAIRLVNKCGELFNGELKPEDFILASVVSGELSSEHQ